MQLFNRTVLTEHELEDLKRDIRSEAWEGAEKYWKKETKARLVNLEKENERLEKRYDDLLEDKEDFEAFHEKTVTKLEEKIEVLEEERDNTREVVKQQIVNADKEAVIAAEKERLEARESKLKDRENKIGTEEDKRYKEGYADGVADGVRKIGEITQKDRDNAMKVAMVAASSHTPVDNLKELNSVHQLTAGTQDSKAKKS